MQSLIARLKSLPLAIKFSAIAGVLSASTVNRVISFIFLASVARLFGPAEFAKLSLSIAVMTITASVLDFGSNLSFVKRYGDTSSESKKRDLIRVILKWNLILLVLICGVSYPASQLVSRYLTIFRSDSLLLLLAFCSGGLLNVVGVLQAIEQARKEFKTFVSYNYFSAICRFSLGVLCILTHQLSLAIVFFSLYAGPFLLLLIFTVRRTYKYLLTEQRHERSVRLQDEARLLKPILVYGIWLGVTTALCSLPMQIPQFAMANNVKAEEMGFYSAGLAFIPIFQLTYEAARTVIFPDVASIQDVARRNQYRKTLWKASPLFFSFMFSALVITAGAQYLLLGNQYRSSIPVFVILGSFFIFAAYFNYLNILVHSLGKPYLETVSVATRILLITGLTLTLPKTAIAMSIAAGGVWFLGEFATYLVVQKLDSATKSCT